ncbi:hypothetical protein CSW58_11125 [Caulobacter sp. B11]|uniref:hypothetical protein n=1 Tax=Caulobacter sp. B11 TaxID=2048899 RepID=UPI000C12BB80|nr:hypothetical protein [Caulobacter sp. B11]PHY12658.1 hypothetical protein CSW58_11125 [Caulobacter sp. B11]
MIPIREDQLIAHLAWATFTFQDMVQLRLGGHNPFDNTATVYRGSADDVGAQTPGSSASPPSPRPLRGWPMTPTSRA